VRHGETGEWCVGWSFRNEPAWATPPRLPHLWSEDDARLTAMELRKRGVPAHAICLAMLVAPFGWY